MLEEGQKACWVTPPFKGPAEEGKPAKGLVGRSEKGRGPEAPAASSGKGGDREPHARDNNRQGPRAQRPGRDG